LLLFFHGFLFFFCDDPSDGCCKAEYDSTYPAPLNGVISQSEFRESIDNINKSRPSSVPGLVCILIVALCILAGMGLCIAGGITAALSGKFQFPVMLGVGIGLFAFGMIFCIVSLCIISAVNSGKLQKAVAQESEKYSSRSPTPCSWRIHTTRTVVGTTNNQRTHVDNQVSHPI
jgi:uncharacterized membrane protein